MFACPILRQQSTDSNPPVRLVCGHVISRDALQKLTSGSKWAPLLPHIDHTATLQQKYVSWLSYSKQFANKCLQQ